VGEIVWLGRYPVKSMLGEARSSMMLTGSGVGGDRRYALIDQDTGLVASAKHPGKWRSLLTMRARYEPGDARVSMTLPDGTTVMDDDAVVDQVLSRGTGRSVRLARSRPPGARLERMSPLVEANAGELTRGPLAAAAPGRSFVDFAPVHVVTTATLDALARAHPGGTMDARRFRPNLVLRMVDDAPFVENIWPGRTLSTAAGTAVRMLVPTPRCPVPGLAQGGGEVDQELPEDPYVLRVAARLNRTAVLDLGVLTCVGGYGAVHRPGPLRVGDRIQLSA
jgi:uncharacterized protein